MVILGKPGNFAGAIGSALNLRKLTTNIQIFAGGKITDADKKNAEARWSGWETVIKKTYDISVHEADTTKIERTAKGKEPYDDEYKLTLDGSIRTLITIGVLMSTDHRQITNLHKKPHLQMDGTSVKVVFNMESSIGGIYVVGDANNDGSTNAYHAMWSAKRAVVNAHGKLS
jgi:thioredoxin reductase